MKVAEIMQTNVELAGTETTVRDLAQKMKTRDCGSIPVEKDDRLIGMVTDRDIVVRCIAGNQDPDQTKADDIMTEKVYYCYDDQDAEEIAENMGENSIRRLPVLNRDKRLVGIVSLADTAVGCDDEEVCGEALQQIRKAAA